MPAEDLLINHISTKKPESRPISWDFLVTKTSCLTFRFQHETLSLPIGSIAVVDLSTSSNNNCYLLLHVDDYSNCCSSKHGFSLSIDFIISNNSCGYLREFHSLNSFICSIVFYLILVCSWVFFYTFGISVGDIDIFYDSCTDEILKDKSY